MKFIEYFYYPDTYNKIAKQVGFKGGIEFIDVKSFFYDTTLNNREQEMAKEYFNNPQPSSMFILRK